MDYKLLIFVLILYLGLITDARHQRRHRGKNQRIHRHRHGTRGQGRMSRVRGKSRELFLLPYEATENVQVKERMNVSLWKLNEDKSVRQHHLGKRDVPFDDHQAPGKYFNTVRAPWPRPQAFDTDPGRVYRIDPHNFRFVVSPSSKTCHTLIEALRRHYKEITRRAPTTSRVYNRTKTIQSVKVTVMTSCVDESPETDSNETYNLAIKDSGGFIRADDVVGILRGLATLVQLTYVNTEGQIYINHTKITDFPIVKHRAFFINTARRKIKSETLKKILDFMEMNKLNLLHWKLMSHKASRFSGDIPQGQKENYSWKMYNDTVIRDIVNYARQRGIAVMPEINIMGDVISWRDRHCPEEDIAFSIDTLSKPEGLHTAWTKILDQFPGTFILVREDDVFSSCWETSPSIQRFMTTHGMPGYQELSLFLRQRLLGVLEKLNQKRTLVFGEEVLSSKYPVDKTSIIHVEKASPQSVIQKGYRVLYSLYRCYNTTVKLLDWSCLYKQTVKTPHLKLFWGVEAGAVGDYTDDITLLDTARPSTSTMAQIAWSYSARAKFDQGFWNVLVEC